jgi:hypothetical protein
VVVEVYMKYIKPELYKRGGTEYLVFRN